MEAIPSVQGGYAVDLRLSGRHVRRPISGRLQDIP